MVVISKAAKSHVFFIISKFLLRNPIREGNMINPTIIQTIKNVNSSNIYKILRNKLPPMTPVSSKAGASSESWSPKMWTLENDYFF